MQKCQKSKKSVEWSKSILNGTESVFLKPRAYQEGKSWTSGTSFYQSKRKDIHGLREGIVIIDEMTESVFDTLSKIRSAYNPLKNEKKSLAIHGN